MPSPFVAARRRYHHRDRDSNRDEAGQHSDTDRDRNERLPPWCRRWRSHGHSHSHHQYHHGHGHGHHGRHERHSDPEASRDVVDEKKEKDDKEKETSGSGEETEGTAIPGDFRGSHAHHHGHHHHHQHQHGSSFHGRHHHHGGHGSGRHAYRGRARFEEPPTAAVVEPTTPFVAHVPAEWQVEGREKEDGVMPGGLEE
ncbi:MAG: hypothetical protein INR71_08015, partial [Terriglobus roseus]|nr:hypothetical protein [Terriglobus roseus]